jgi:hypothetical protein
LRVIMPTIVKSVIKRLTHLNVSVLSVFLASLCCLLKDSNLTMTRWSEWRSTNISSSLRILTWNLTPQKAWASVKEFQRLKKKRARKRLRLLLRRSKRSHQNTLRSTMSILFQV